MSSVVTLACSFPWLTSVLPSSSSSSKFLKYQSCPSFSKPCHRAVYCCGSQPQYAVTDLGFVLHDALDSSGVDTTHAREARKGFMSQIERLSSIERQTSISINRRVDLGKTALYIAAEDDSLVSHSSVPLPVDAFVERLDDLSTGYLSFYNSSFGSSPEIFLECLESYLYGKKGFRRSYYTRNQLEPRALYLHSVLTHRSGSAAMLSLIYSEILKMLRLWTILDFDCEIFFPHDRYGLPRGYHKLKSKASDQSHIMTTQNLLVEVLKNLKEAFWPFQHDDPKTLFLSAAEVANCTDKSNVVRERYFHFTAPTSQLVFVLLNFSGLKTVLATIQVQVTFPSKYNYVRCNLQVEP
ncbi:transglutaminase family protein [Tripterygium wilfordii]|uniref:Transglutaminase family protein n=1 Tax=Tripterygium wilfordii TaxID=458696 RepID=A0A7J7CHY9_TRIWF|nr:transglutaminase family protein [Tripterygium wilfordii]